MKIDIPTGELSEKNSMINGRYWFGICNILGFIYVVGGRLGISVQTCERFNVLTEVWEELNKYNNCNFPDQFCIGITIVTIQKRFIYGFGGENKQMDTEDPKMERIARLDTSRLKKGWTQQRLINPTNSTGCRYGVVPLPQDNNDEAKFLIFGGLSGLDNIFRTMLLETKIADFSDTRY